MKSPEVFQRKRDCNTCGQPDCILGYPTPIGFRLFCSPICANVYLGYPLDFELELDEEKYYFFESEGDEDIDILPIGSKVRSYDFVIGDKILDDSTYMEGYILKFAPVPNCAPDCNHYHILTTRIIRKGEEIPLDDESWASTFTTHWDNAGVLPIPDDPDDITKIKDAEEENYEHPDGPYYCDVCERRYGRKVMIKKKIGEEDRPDVFTDCLCGRKERARKMEEESDFGKKLKKLREEGELSTNYYGERPTTYEEYPQEEPTGVIGASRRKEHWPPTSGMHWYDEIGEQMTFWTVPSWGSACSQCGAKNSTGGLLQIEENRIGPWEEKHSFICNDCVNESELLWWAITGAKPDEPRNPLLKGLLAESFEAESFKDKMELGGYLIADGTRTKVSVSKDALDNFGKRKIIDEFQERIANSSPYFDEWVHENFKVDYEVLRVRWEDI